MNETSINSSSPEYKLTIISDVDCAFYLDGEETMQLKAKLPVVILLPAGRYLLKFVRDNYPSDMLWASFKMPTADCFYQVQLLASMDEPKTPENNDDKNKREDGLAQRIVKKIRHNQEARNAYRLAEMKKMEAVVKTAEQEAERLAKLNEAKEKEKKLQQMESEEISLIKKYFDNELFTEAVPLIKRNVEKGSAEAKYYLGMLYEQGKGGIKQNLQAALKYYRMSAEQGNTDAQNAISRLEGGLDK